MKTNIILLLCLTCFLGSFAQAPRKIAIRPADGKEVDFYLKIGASDPLIVKPKGNEFVLPDSLLENYGQLPCRLVFRNALHKMIYFNRLYSDPTKEGEYLEGGQIKLEAIATDVYNTYYLHRKASSVME